MQYLLTYTERLNAINNETNPEAKRKLEEKLLKDANNPIDLSCITHLSIHSAINNLLSINNLLLSAQSAEAVRVRYEIYRCIEIIKDKKNSDPKKRDEAYEDLKQISDTSLVTKSRYTWSTIWQSIVDVFRSKKPEKNKLFDVNRDSRSQSQTSKDNEIDVNDGDASIQSIQSVLPKVPIKSNFIYKTTGKIKEELTNKNIIVAKKKRAANATIRKAKVANSPNKEPEVELQYSSYYKKDSTNQNIIKKLIHDNCNNNLNKNSHTTETNPQLQNVKKFLNDSKNIDIDVCASLNKITELFRTSINNIIKHVGTDDINQTQLYQLGSECIESFENLLRNRSPITMTEGEYKYLIDTLVQDITKVVELVCSIPNLENNLIAEFINCLFIPDTDTVQSESSKNTSIALSRLIMSSTDFEDCCKCWKIVNRLDERYTPTIQHPSSFLPDPDPCTKPKDNSEKKIHQSLTSLGTYRIDKRNSSSTSPKPKAAQGQHLAISCAPSSSRS